MSVEECAVTWATAIPAALEADVDEINKMTFAYSSATGSSTTTLTLPTTIVTAMAGDYTFTITPTTRKGVAMTAVELTF
jgi:hypothetical protein